MSINNNGLGLFPLKASSCSTNITLCRGRAFHGGAAGGLDGWLTGCERAEIVSLGGDKEKFILLFFAGILRTVR